MPRQNALEKLQSRLIHQRADLLRKISEELGEVSPTDDGINDIAEQALQDERSELHAQLAARESRELRDIEHALVLIKNGRYGECEGCGKAIPVARLQAVPFTSTCVQCQELQERNGPSYGEDTHDWSSAAAYERANYDVELTLRDLDQSPEGE